jgi:hypothetical protein
MTHLPAAFKAPFFKDALDKHVPGHARPTLLQ